jgi:hypothetical protein
MQIDMKRLCQLAFWLLLTVSAFGQQYATLGNVGVGLIGGQVADPAVIQIEGATYLYYDAIATQANGGIHVKLATAPYPLSQITLALFP